MGKATTHADHTFSVTVRTDDKGVLYCVRALSKLAQATGNNQIPWGGTKDSDWERDRHRVTFRFSSPEYRRSFLDLAKRLLPTGSWDIVEERDDDPAVAQPR